MQAYAVVTRALFALACTLCISFVLSPNFARADNSETILTGKVLCTVMRSEPIPFHAVVDEVLVKPGDPVKKGMPLLHFHLQSEAARMLQKELTRGADTEELRSKILELEREQARLEALCKKNRQLVSSGLGSKQALLRQEREVSALAERIGLLRKTIAKAEETFKGRLKELEVYFGVPLSEGMPLPETPLSLPAPLDGYVLSVAGIFPGSLLQQGSAPILVGPLDPILVQVPVYEGEVSDIQAGKAAKIVIPSLDNKSFEAKVQDISWVSTDMNVEKPSYFTVKLLVPNPHLELKPGYKAVVHF